MNPYNVEGPALISFSGGRTSGYMLWHILHAHDGALPENVHVAFANTGKEREETLRFVHECSSRWGVKIHWLEWRGRSGEINTRIEEVGFNSASRNGEPFASLVEVKKYLPNPLMRFCTIELKIRVMKHFMMLQGYEHWRNLIGLRHDEQRRVVKAKMPQKERWTNVLPLDDAKVTNADVKEFWKKQDFDLQLLPFEGNCDACFLKARPKLYEIERTNPGALNWWSQIEKKTNSTFRKEFSFENLINDVRRQPDMFQGLFDHEAELDAECGLWCEEV